MRRLLSLMNLWVILGGLLVAALLVGLFGLLIFLLPLPPGDAANQPSFTVISAPTPTPVPTKPIVTPTPTHPPAIDGIYVGAYVQIAGTDGAGLRLRTAPGTTSDARLLGMDSEVFLVKDGPQTADDFTWWFLEAPYDPERSGWAASRYLSVVAAPTVEPGQ